MQINKPRIKEWQIYVLHSIKHEVFVNPQIVLCKQEQQATQMLQNNILHSLLLKHNHHGAVTSNAGTISFLSRLYHRLAYLQQKWISSSALLPNHNILRNNNSKDQQITTNVIANLTMLHSTSSKILSNNLSNIDQDHLLWHNNECALELCSSVSYIAKTQEYVDFSKRHGEDAYFIYTNPNITADKGVVPASHPSNHPVTISALDGVGSYKLRGIDPAHMAWSVMDNAKRIISENPTIQCPRDVLIQAYETIVSKKQVKAGGTTALLVMIQQDAHGKLKLKCANLGDCGLMVIRKQTVVYRTTDQTHAFNAPYQLAIPPEGLHNVIQDSPKVADILECPIELQEGDYVVLGSDGLFDNIFDEKIVEMVWNHEQRAQMFERPDFAKMLQRLTHDMVELCKKISKDNTTCTPFAKYAQAYNYAYSGGKHDDIACIIARATTKPNIVKT